MGADGDLLDLNFLQPGKNHLEDWQHSMPVLMQPWSVFGTDWLGERLPCGTIGQTQIPVMMTMTATLYVVLTLCQAPSSAPYMS